MGCSRAWAALTVLLLVIGPAPGLATPPLPDEPVAVFDRAGLLSAPAEARLVERLERLRAETGRTVVIGTVEGLGGQSIEAFGRGLVDHWRLDETAAPGAMLLVAWRERRVWLAAVAPGGPPDAARLRPIVDRLILPAFRRQGFDHGIEAGVDALLSALDDGAADAPSAATAGAPTRRAGPRPALALATALAGLALGAVAARRLGGAHGTSWAPPRIGRRRQRKERGWRWVT